MRTIDINKNINITRLVFPDNQPHVRIENIKEGDEVKVKVLDVDRSGRIKLSRKALLDKADA